MQAGRLPAVDRFRDLNRMGKSNMCINRLKSWSISAVIFFVLVTVWMAGLPKLVAQEVAQPASDGGSVASHANTSHANAALVYWQAFAAMQELDSELLESRLPKSIELSQVNAVLSSCEYSLRLLHLASEQDVCDWGLPDGLGPDLQLPHLVRARRLARAAILRSRIRMIEGDTRALDDVAAVLKLTDQLAADSYLVGALVSGAVQEELVELLADQIWMLKDEQVELLQDLLAGIDEREIFVRAMEDERELSSWIRGLVQRQQGDESLDNDASRLAAVLKELARGMAIDSGSSDTDEMIDRWVRELGGDLQKLVQLLDEHDKLLEQAIGAIGQNSKEFSNTVRDIENQVQANPLSRLVFPSISQVHKSLSRIRARRQMLRLGVAIRLSGGGDIEAIARRYPNPDDNELFLITSDENNRLEIRTRKSETAEEPIELSR